MIIIENIVTIFRFDCFICASSGIDLKGYMMNKHKWNEETYNEYKHAYMITLCTKLENVATAEYTSCAFENGY